LAGAEKSKIQKVLTGANRDRPDAIIRPFSGAYLIPAGTEPMSLTQWKTLYILIHRAKDEILEDKRHKVRFTDVNITHLSNKEALDFLQKMRGIGLTCLDDKHEKYRIDTIFAGPFEVDRDPEKDKIDGAGYFRYRFSETFKDLYALDDSGWVALSMPTIMRCSSKYSLKLYLIASNYFQLDNSFARQREMDLEEFRRQMEIPAGTYPYFKHLEDRVLIPAQKELKKISHVTLKGWERIHDERNRRKVVGIRLFFEPVHPDDMDPVIKEINQSIFGRKARMAGTVEQIGDLPTEFPADTIRGTIFETIAKEHGGGWDVNRIGDQYRDFLKRKKINSAGMAPTQLVNSFKGFCKSYVSKEGKPV